MAGYKSTKLKDSRELAARLRKLADWLELRDTFKVEYGGYLSAYDGKFSLSFSDKNSFVEAVKALGDSEKQYTTGEFAKLVVSAKWAPIELNIPRDRVCTKKIVYDCEPIFSAEEVEAL
jgi:hypothetical protein